MSSVIDRKIRFFSNNLYKSDLKPENFLLKYSGDIRSIKLIDFGLSKKLKENEILTQPNGTVKL